MTVTWAVLVDWNGDGDWGDAGEDVTARVRAAQGISAERGRDQLRMLAPPMAGRFDAELDNQSRDYSTENAASPLAGNLLPGRLVRFTGTTGGTTYYLFTGPLDDLPQRPGRSQRSVGIPALGTLSRLRQVAEGDDEQKGISTQLYSSIRTDQALGYLLDAAGWPAADRVFDTGKTTLAWWWLENADPWSAMMEILASEGPGAYIGEDGQGRLVFESRHYRLLTARCTTAQATFRDTGAEPLFSEPFSLEPSLKGVVNVATAECKTRTAKALAVVWSLGSTVTLSAGEVRAFKATNADPFTAAVCVNATDYTVSAGSLASATLDRTSGQSCTITLTAGASGATVTGLQVRAQPVTVDNTTKIANTINTATSQARYGKRVYPFKPRAEMSINVLQDLVNATVGYYQEPRSSGELTLKSGPGGDSTRETQCVAREISDRIHIVEAQTGLDADAYVERIKLATDGTLIATTLGYEKADSVNYLVWGTGKRGEAAWGF